MSCVLQRGHKDQSRWQAKTWDRVNWLKTAVWVLWFCVNLPRWRVSQDNWFGTAKIICLCVPAERYVSSLLQGLMHSCPTRLHRISPRDHIPLLSKFYAWARHQCVVTGLLYSFWASVCCSEASRTSRKVHSAAAMPTSQGIHTYLSKCWINGKKKCPTTELNSFGLEASSAWDWPCPREKWSLDTACSIWLFHFTGHCQGYRFLAAISFSATACLYTYGY